MLSNRGSRAPQGSSWIIVRLTRNLHWYPIIYSLKVELNFLDMGETKLSCAVLEIWLRSTIFVSRLSFYCEYDINRFSNWQWRNVVKMCVNSDHSWSILSVATGLSKTLISSMFLQWEILNSDSLLHLKWKEALNLCLLHFRKYIWFGSIA